MKLKAGDKVKLNKNIKNFRYGKGIVNYDEIGTIIEIDEYKDICVSFPSRCRWYGLKSELVLANGKKFFKKLPNNFTGTIEVEDGYIVEKEILDEKEKEYLSNVIKPFRDKVEYICKEPYINKEFIKITIKNDSSLCFPYFIKETMYKCMEANKKYTLKELGLDE